MRLACSAAFALACLAPAIAGAQSAAPVAPAAPKPATAQPSTLLPAFVVDARLALPRMGQSTVTATSLGVDPLDIPSRAIVPVIGAHVYVLRRPGFALGIGGEFIRVHATHQPIDAATGKPIGAAIARGFTSVSPQVSLNFGRKMGWSYLSGGMGPVTFDTYRTGATPDGLHPFTLNYGAGARWFSSTHVAFALDLRFYVTKPAEATAVVGERARETITVFSAGIAIK